MFSRSLGPLNAICVLGRKISPLAYNSVARVLITLTEGGGGELIHVMGSVCMWIIGNTAECVARKIATFSFIFHCFGGVANLFTRLEKRNFFFFPHLLACRWIVFTLGWCWGLPDISNGNFAFIETELCQLCKHWFFSNILCLLKTEKGYEYYCLCVNSIFLFLLHQKIWTINFSLW